MKLSTLALAIAAGMLSAAPTLADDSGMKSKAPGASEYSPGHEMQNEKGKSTGPGASEYSPGHEMQSEQGKSKGPGASEYSPGDQAKDKDKESGSTTGAGAGTQGKY